MRTVMLRDMRFRSLLLKDLCFLRPPKRGCGVRHDATARRPEPAARKDHKTDGQHPTIIPVWPWFGVSTVPTTAMFATHGLKRRLAIDVATRKAGNDGFIFVRGGTGSDSAK